MFKKNKHTTYLILVVAVLFSSCRATRTLEEGQYLQRKNHIEFADENPGIDESSMQTIIRPKPNRRFLGLFPLQVSLYNLGLRGNQDKKFRKWLREKVGERPVVYDSMLVKKSAAELELYLNKVGYFHSTVTPETKFKRNRHAHTYYYVELSRPYRIRNFKMEVKDSTLRGYIKPAFRNSEIAKGEIFNSFELEEERERISNYLRNEGYYYFDRAYIFFEADSTVGNRHMDVTLKVKNNQVYSKKNPGVLTEQPHRRYFINDIYINTVFDPSDRSASGLDTTTFILDYKRSNKQSDEYKIIYRDKLKINPKVLGQSIFIRNNEPFNELDVRKTRSRINEIGAFNYNNIYFAETSGPDSDTLLDSYIDLVRKKLHAFTVETEGTNKSGRLGIGAIFTYQNNNLFRGAEILRFSVRGSLEFQRGVTASGDETIPQDKRLFNTYETGGEVSITFPKFLVPVNQERFPRYFRPKSVLRGGISYEDRPQYTRLINNISFGYEWQESEFKTHLLYPVDLNLVDVTLDPEYQDIIENEPNDRIRNQYTDHLVLGLKYSFIYNNQEINKLKNFIFFRANAEPAGNLLQLISNIFKIPTDTGGYYTINRIRFSQYFRTDFDFRFYQMINRDNSLVYRLFTGIGIPYGNAEVLPLERGFYGGGANGMRAWRLRTLGPGSYNNPDDVFDRMGDLQIELNLEYRFPVYKFLKGAIFADIGNIWLLQKDESYPGGQFQINTFYKELAVSSGIGVRFDFNFFIVRADFAGKIKDPSLPEGSRWNIRTLQFRDFIVNIGIGYPF